QQHALGQVWYDDLIISTQPIAMGSGGSTTQPPVPVAPALGVSFTSPANGSTVSGSVTVSASVSGPGIAGVQFKLDGQNLGAEVTNAPYSDSWNSASAANGTHTLGAIARDTSGNQASASVSVMVSNSTTPPPTPPPTTPPPSGPPDITTGLVGYWKFDEGSGTT